MLFAVDGVRIHYGSFDKAYTLLYLETQPLNKDDIDQFASFVHTVLSAVVWLGSRKYLYKMFAIISMPI